MYVDSGSTEKKKTYGCHTSEAKGSFCIELTLKDVRAHCYCASLQRTQIHMSRHASSARAKY